MYENDILEQKKNIINMVYETNISAHLSPAFAALEIFNVLLRDIMSIPDGLESDNSDKMVLSNGHTALGLYAVYCTLGYISVEDLYTYKKKNSPLSVHPDRNLTPGCFISTGSLGHGLPNAVGVAYAWKLDNKNNKIYVLVGDGELNEGSIWESVIFAARMGLDNLICIIDDNKSTDYMPNILDKFKAFGWKAEEVDGHNEDELRRAFNKKHEGYPYVIIANTIKGKGVSFFEKQHAKWHENRINDEEYNAIMGELS